MKTRSNINIWEIKEPNPSKAIVVVDINNEPEAIECSYIYFLQI